jgi:hypothetical protein
MENGWTGWGESVMRMIMRGVAVTEPVVRVLEPGVAGKVFPSERLILDD